MHLHERHADFYKHFISLNCIFSIYNLNFNLNKTVLLNE